MARKRKGTKWNYRDFYQDVIDFFTCYRECMEWIDKRNYHAFEIGVSERPDMIVTKE